MKFGYSIIYVADVPETLEFYGKAFGLKTGFLHDSNMYSELETGETTLAFASDGMAEQNGLSIRSNRSTKTPAGHEIALVTEEPENAFEKAVAAGAVLVKALETKPWGQVVGYVRDINGCLIEICSPVGGK